MTRRRPPAHLLRNSTATTSRTPAQTAIPADAASAAPSPTAAANAPAAKPRILIHIATPDANTLRHLQQQGRITVWVDHRTPADIEIRVRASKSGNTDRTSLAIEALLDEVAPGWTYITPEENQT